MEVSAVICRCSAERVPENMIFIENGSKIIQHGAKTEPKGDQNGDRREPKRAGDLQMEPLHDSTVSIFDPKAGAGISLNLGLANFLSKLPTASSRSGPGGRGMHARKISFGGGVCALCADVPRCEGV